MSQHHIMMTSHSKHYEFSKCWLGTLRHMDKYRSNFVFMTSRDDIKLWSYLIRSTRHPSGSQRPPPCWPQVSPSRWLPEDVWWTLSRSNTVALTFVIYLLLSFIIISEWSKTTICSHISTRVTHAFMFPIPSCISWWIHQLHYSGTLTTFDKK